MQPFEYTYLENVYTTHQPFLEAYVLETSGTILEFGTGYGSTALLTHLLKDTSRVLISIEDNLSWLTQMKQLYPESERHHYIYLEPKEDGSHWQEFLASYTPPKDLSLVFVDQAPWVARLWTLKRFESLADYVIVHDVDYFPHNGIFGSITDPNLPFTEEKKYDFSDVFSSYKMYFPPAPWCERDHGPPTLVGTNLGKKILPYEDIKLDHNY